MMENRQDIIDMLQNMVTTGKNPSDLLRYIVVDCGIEEQVEIMKLFSEALNVTLGEVTPIVGWWHEGEDRELDDEGVDAYLMPLLTAYQQESP